MKPTGFAGNEIAGRLVAVPSRSLVDLRLRPHHRQVLQWLCYLDSQSVGGWFEISHRRIGKLVQRNRSTVATTARELEALGYIERRPQVDPSGRRLSNLYRVVYDPPVAEANGPVGGANTTAYGMSPPVTYRGEGVGATDRGSVGSADSFLKVKESEGSEESKILIKLFIDLHHHHFPGSPSPDPQKLAGDIDTFSADGLPPELARQVIEVVFDRLRVRGSTRVSSFRVLGQTWRFIANRWRDAGKPTDPDAWEDLFNENRHAWAEFQSIYPRPEGLKADVTRAAFDQAARAAGGAHVVVDAARRYASRMRVKDERFIKSPAKWLADGFWRDDVPTEPAPSTSAGESPSPQANLQVGRVDDERLQPEVWAQVVADLVARHGHERTELGTWFRNATVRAPAPDVIAIEFDSKFLRDQVETRFGDHLRAAFGARVGDGVTVSVVARI